MLQRKSKYLKATTPCSLSLKFYSVNSQSFLLKVKGVQKIKKKTTEGLVLFFFFIVSNVKHAWIMILHIRNSSLVCPRRMNGDWGAGVK